VDEQNADDHNGNEGVLGDVIRDAIIGSGAGGEDGLTELGREAHGDVIGSELTAPADEQDGGNRGGTEGAEAGDWLGEITGSGLNSPVDEGNDDDETGDGGTGGAENISLGPAIGGSDVLPTHMEDASVLGEGDGQSGAVLSDVLADLLANEAASNGVQEDE
jgi:hypothetical protein